ncbi:MAG: glycosyltransferase family 4 protein [Solirubrobacterales bacterium]|nr:glycosyltransferase family 4 protein [Solirubrobacterales bacterium]
MKVAFVLNNLGLYGGVGIVVEHARRLRADHGMDAQLVLAPRERRADWTHAGLVDVPVRTLDEARGERWDLAVATWWETLPAIYELDAARRAYFVQSMEERFYGPGEPERAAAALTHDLPLAFITEARWIAEQLRALQPGATVLYVRNGIDKAVFGPVPSPPVALDGPLRIVVEGSPDVPLKGVPDALAAAAAMREPHTVTLVCADREAATAAGARADRVVGPLTPAQMADLYDDCDVVLKLSRVEGMSAPPLEGFHRGATCVVSPVTGHEEYVVDGFNGVVVGWDDEHGCARALDLLARDRGHLHFLRVNALATARAWPSTGRSAETMALALARIARLPSPDPTGSGARVLAAARAAMEEHAVQRRDHQRLQTRMDRVERIMSRGPLRAARKLASRVRRS